MQGVRLWEEIEVEAQESHSFRPKFGREKQLRFPKSVAKLRQASARTGTLY
jgi:hypothetical protein